MILNDGCPAAYLYARPWFNGTVATYGIRYVRLSPNEDHINHS